MLRSNLDYANGKIIEREISGNFIPEYEKWIESFDAIF